MNIARLISFGIVLSAAVTMSVSAQDFDDIYYNPSTPKAKAERQAQKKALEARRNAVTVISVSNGDNQYYGDYPPADLFNDPNATGTQISIDEYNRRGIFATTDTAIVNASGNESEGDFAYTQRIRRFHNPQVAADDEEVNIYLAQQPATTVNIIVENPGYYDYWGSPWGYDPFWGQSWVWDYKPYWGYGYSSAWNWGWNSPWGPSWTWGPTWSWAWGPSWAWGWGPWGPSIGGSWAWGGVPVRPAHSVSGVPGAYSYNPRQNGKIPSSGRRPGADGYHTGSGLYPTFDHQGNVTGAVRPGAGQRPGTSNSGYHPSNGNTYRPGNTSSDRYVNGSYNYNSSGQSYSRPGRSDSTTGNSSSYRPGNSSGSTRSSGGGTRSSGGGGGSRSSGGGTSNRGGRH